MLKRAEIIAIKQKCWENRITNLSSASFSNPSVFASSYKLLEISRKIAQNFLKSCSKVLLLFHDLFVMAQGGFVLAEMEHGVCDGVDKQI